MNEGREPNPYCLTRNQRRDLKFRPEYIFDPVPDDVKRRGTRFHGGVVRGVARWIIVSTDNIKAVTGKGGGGAGVSAEDFDYYARQEGYRIALAIPQSTNGNSGAS